MASYIGIDPGGQNSFGWCQMQYNETSDELISWEFGTCSNIRDVISAIKLILVDTPKAVGIDAPLYWSRNGDRISDQKIRKAVSRAGGHASTVGHVNSLRGACLVQGILTLVTFKEIWPEIMVTESHPKALLAVAPEMKNYQSNFKFGTDHERDACLSAFAAKSFYTCGNGWEDYLLLESDIYIPTPYGVSYWFPSV